MKKLFILVLGLLLAGCSRIVGPSPTPEPTPTLPNPSITTVAAPDAEQTARTFLEHWAQREYEGMYAMLSPDSQDQVPWEDFLKRYDNTWRNAALSGLSYEIVSSLINPREAQVRYRVTLQSSIVGDLTRETWMDLKRFGESWKIAWSQKMILPEMTDGSGLLLAPLIPTRANIYDREGLALATEGDVAALWIVPNEIGDEDTESTMLGALSRLFNRPQEGILELYDDIRQFDWYVHLGEVSLEEFQPFRDTLAATGGVNWRIYPSRYYYGGGIAPHAAGYVSWIPKDDLDTYLMQGYQQDEFVGQRGVERVFESELRGIPGGTLYLTDSDGTATKVLAHVDPEPSKAVYTTLDRQLQRHVQEAIEGFTGAVVVLERDTGAVLAMASSPAFDPNLFDPDHPYSSAGLAEIFGNEERPLVNRVTRGEYPLGSVFKIITMSAALESGYYEPDTIYYCGSDFREIPGLVLYDWTYDRGWPPQGDITLHQALERSCNPYFYHIGKDLYDQDLPEALPDMASSFGLGQPTGIELGDEDGLVPRPESKQEKFGEEWGPQDAVNLAIGQSFLQVTPLQVARFIAAVGNGGTLYQPQLVSKIVTPDGELVDEFEPVVQGELPVSPAWIEAIQEAMVGVIRDQKGTARGKFLGLSLNIAGKTGTATTGDFTEPHSWFVGYSFEGREDLPDIAAVVLLEYQGEGSSWAAPVFRRVVESYFFGRPYSPYPWEARIGVPKTPTPTPDPEELNAEETPTPES